MTRSRAVDADFFTAVLVGDFLWGVFCSDFFVTAFLATILFDDLAPGADCGEDTTLVILPTCGDCSESNGARNIAV